MTTDGTLTATSAIQSRTNSYAITYQATPWLEGTFRYTGFNDFSYWDRNYEAKLLLWSENIYRPQVAVGIRDLVGTGIWGSEYLVASKKIGDFDLTLGLGWGRLSGNGSFKNPLSLLDDRFDNRVNNFGLGGKVSTDSFFRGKRVGLFGGFEYSSQNTPLSLMIEYNPDQYDWEIQNGAKKPKYPLSAALKWDFSSNASLKLSYQHGEEWGVEIAAALDTKSSTIRQRRPVFRSSLDLTQQQLPSGFSKQSWYDTLLFDAERSGVLLIEASLDRSKRSATLVMGNMSYPLWTDAVDIMADLADLHLPLIVSVLNIVVEEEGHRVHSIRMRRPSLNFSRNKQLVEREIIVEPFRSTVFAQHRTDFFQKKIIFDINLSNRVQLFDPDDPARYQLYAKIGLRMMLPQNWVLSGAVDRDIKNNFDESTRESNSLITRVRSDVVRYLTEGESGLDSFFVQKRGNLKSDIFYRAFGGILESMYSGIGGEVVYQPFQSRLAFGFSANWVKQRDYDKTFNHLDYQTETVFASAYWATPFYNFDIAIHAGKYLAKDLGATLEIRRTFDNGWMVGLWATKTNVSAADFGEGSFDKGLFFKIPLNKLIGANSRSSYITRIRPIQRDGGQYLEDFTGNIWWGIRSARYDVFRN